MRQPVITHRSMAEAKLLKMSQAAEARHTHVLDTRVGEVKNAQTRQVEQRNRFCVADPGLA